MIIYETKLKNATFRYIESELYAYKDTLKEINNLRDEIMNNRVENDDGIGNNNKLPSSTTEQIATKLLTHKTLRNLEEVAQAITDVYEAVTDVHREIIQLKYFGNPNLTWGDVAIKVNYHRNTVYKLRREVIYLIANKLGMR